MIGNICNIIKQDIKFLDQLVYGKRNEPKREQAQRLVDIAIRALAVFGMALAATAAIGTVSASGVGAVFGLAAAAVLFTLSHDAFVMTANLKKGTVAKALTTAKNFFQEGWDVLTGNKALKDFKNPLRETPVEGTILKPVWDIILA